LTQTLQDEKFKMLCVAPWQPPHRACQHIQLEGLSGAGRGGRSCDFIIAGRMDANALFELSSCSSTVYRLFIDEVAHHATASIAAN
jgi:hypothetical protein